MQTRWFSHLKAQDDKEKFKKLVLGSHLVLDKAYDIVYNMLIELESVSTTDYDSPSWSHKQADRNGRAAAYREVMKLLKINSDKE